MVGVDAHIPVHVSLSLDRHVTHPAVGQQTGALVAVPVLRYQYRYAADTRIEMMDHSNRRQTRPDSHAHAFNSFIHSKGQFIR